MSEAPKVGTTYKYIKYMPNGGTEERTGVVRSRSAGRKKKRNNKRSRQD